MTNPLEMSDEDFLKNLGSMAAASTPSSEGNTPEEQTPAPEAQTPVEEPVEELTEAERAAQAEGEEETPAPVEGEAETKPEGEAETPATPKEGEIKPEGEQQGEKDPAPVETPINYEQAYADILKPFKANGRTVEVRSPEEARQLMQMGANYTKKMQALQQHNKVLMMLQNNDLLDAGKLDYLVALDKKDPEAIKKLIKDSGIDPLDIDTNTDHAFQPGQHTVTDQEAEFRTVLDELDSTPEGKETLDEIDKTWDPASKKSLLDNPSALNEIHKHREIGIYDLIAAEIAHQTTLGKIPASQSFVTSYKTVGDALAAAGAFDNLGKPKAEEAPVVPVKEEPKVVIRRPATPSKTVANDDKASAAASSRAAPTVAKPAINILAMSDDDFLKQMQGRV